MDNPNPEMDNLAPVDDATDAGLVSSDDQGTPNLSSESVGAYQGWKDRLSPDLRDSSLAQKFEDTPEGLNKFAEAHANLEKLLGHEKVPIPKGDDDTEGWNRFSKAMGIPDKAEAYGLPDPQLAEGIQGMAVDKNKFSEIAHAHKLTPAQAKGLWEAYTSMTNETFSKHMQEQEAQLDHTINSLKGEWGDAYETNVELGQLVINKFADSPEMNDFVTATLSKSPLGIKFLAKLGDQFAEHNMGEFKMKRFSLGPEQAQEEIDKIVKDPGHPYNDINSSPREREAAIDYVNSLYATISRAKGQAGF
jgi:hypothetical protein